MLQAMLRLELVAPTCRIMGMDRKAEKFHVIERTKNRRIAEQSCMQNEMQNIYSEEKFG